MNTNLIPNKAFEGMIPANTANFIMDTDNGEIVNKLQSFQALKTIYPGSIVIYNDKTYYVDGFDTENYTAYCHQIKPRHYHTEPVVHTRLGKINPVNSRYIEDSGILTSLGVVECSSSVKKYRCIRNSDGQKLSECRLVNPLRLKLLTKCCVFDIPIYSFKNIPDLTPKDFAKCLAHVLVPNLAEVTQADLTKDIAFGVIQDRKKNSVSIVIYELAPDGEGVCQRAYDKMEVILSKALISLVFCHCKDGCMECIGSNNTSKSCLTQVLDRLVSVMPICFM